jgi:DNA-binding winged helix-turn-helix (wHTH) protein
MDKTVYEFAGVRFTPAYSEIENTETERKTKLSPNRCQFLLLLVENDSQIVTYDDLRRGVWIHQKEVNRELKRTVQSTKRDLVKCFEEIGARADFIKDSPGKGYFLNAQVVKITPKLPGETAEGTTRTTFATATAAAPAETKKIKAAEPLFQSPPEQSQKTRRLFPEHLGFAAASCLLYGSLFGLALVMEIAYEFDRYGERSARVALPLTAWIALTAFVGLKWSAGLIARGKRGALLVGLAFFGGGAGLACAALSFFLPAVPVTAARFQTQPAFAAWMKNALVYFLPLGVFFILLPFQLVHSGHGKAAENKPDFLPNLRPAHLFVLWLAALVYSALTTFYLLDNLLPGRFHNLFVSLVFLRFFLYFGLGLLCLFWFKTNADAAPLKQGAGFLSAGRGDRRRLESLTALFLFCPMLFLTTAVKTVNLRREPPRISGVEAVSQLKGGQQFFVRLRGENFDPESVALQVTGEGCPDSAPCFVPHGALRKHSEITATTLENVPLTLAAGDFQIAAVNAGAPPSNFIALSVP